jgi:hypothetical protein
MKHNPIMILKATSGRKGALVLVVCYSLFAGELYVHRGRLELFNGHSLN